MPRLRIKLDELTAAFCRLLRHRHLLSPTGSNITIMSRRAYLVFGDIEGKLDVLLVECTKCARKGRYSVGRLIEKYGRKSNRLRGSDKQAWDLWVRSRKCCGQASRESVIQTWIRGLSAPMRKGFT